MHFLWNFWCWKFNTSISLTTITFTILDITASYFKNTICYDSASNTFYIVIIYQPAVLRVFLLDYWTISQYFFSSAVKLSFKRLFTFYVIGNSNFSSSKFSGSVINATPVYYNLVSSLYFTCQVNLHLVLQFSLKTSAKQAKLQNLRTEAGKWFSFIPL